MMKSYKFDNNKDKLNGYNILNFKSITFLYE